MKQGTILKTIAWALLVYFAFFVIPPVSSFAATGHSFAAPDERMSLEQDHRQARLYIVDIFIWLKLKQSRQSDTFSIQSDAQAIGAGEIVSAALFSVLLPDQLELPVFFSSTLSRSISGHLSRTADIYYARSGIAPPFLA